MKSTEPKAIVRGRPAPRENYNNDYTTAAGTSGAPQLSPLSPKGEVQDIANKAHELILKKIEFIRKEGGVIFIATAVLTDREILEALQTVDCFCVINKCSSYPRIVNLYNSLSCKYTRGMMPGNILAHLEHKQSPDYGVIDTVRMTGNFYDTMRMRINENRPSLHVSDIGGMIPLEKGAWRYPFVFTGKRNLSEGARSSFEQFNISTTEEFVKSWYDRTAFYYSISHNLFNFPHGIGSDFVWKKKKVSFQKLPKCPDCGETALFSTFWFPSKYGMGAKKVLRCLVCNEILADEELS